MSRYFFKLINNEKLEISDKEFENYINNVNTMQVVETLRSKVYIHNSQILFAYELDGEDDEK